MTLLDKLHDIKMSESDIQTFLELKSQIDELWDRNGRFAGSRKLAVDRRYDKQALILNKYKS